MTRVSHLNTRIINQSKSTKHVGSTDQQHTHKPAQASTCMTSPRVMLSQLSHPDFTNVGTKTPMVFNACSAEVSSTLHLDTNNIANYTTTPCRTMPTQHGGNLQKTPAHPAAGSVGFLPTNPRAPPTNPQSLHSPSYQPRRCYLRRPEHALHCPLAPCHRPLGW